MDKEVCLKGPIYLRSVETREQPPGNSAVLVALEQLGDSLEEIRGQTYLKYWLLAEWRTGAFSASVDGSLFHKTKKPR